MIKILGESNNELKQISTDCIKGVTLLSTEEAENLLTKEERKCTYKGEPCWWWLRSPGSFQGFATYVDNDGSVYCIGSNVDNFCGCVRPALIVNLSSSNLQIGDMFEFGGNKFKIISSEYALCEKAINSCTFREDCRFEDANVYKKSYIKKYIDKWFNKTYKYEKEQQDYKEQGIDTDDDIFRVWAGW